MEFDLREQENLSVREKKSEDRTGFGKVKDRQGCEKEKSEHERKRFGRIDVGEKQTEREREEKRKEKRSVLISFCKNRVLLASF